MRINYILLYLLTVAIFISDAQFMKQFGAIGRYISLAPDLISMVLLLSILMQGIMIKRISLPPKYLFLGALIITHLFIGAIINAVQPGAVVYGIRVYLKYIVIFLLPMIFEFSEEDIKKYLIFVLILSLMQFPISLYQRFVQFSSIETGDAVRGTLTSSGLLSVYLICVISILTAYFVRKKIGILAYISLVIVIFIPTTINESKGTLVLIPFALMLPIFFNTTQSIFSRVKLLSVIAVIGIGLVTVFITVYNDRFQFHGGEVNDFLFKGKVIDELYRENDPGKGYNTGRIDSIVLAVRELSSDPVHLLVGLGMGNVASSFANVLAGEYTEKYFDYGVRVTTIAYLLWEIGAIGILLVMILIYMIFLDAKSASKSEGNLGVLGLGWVAVVMVIFISMFYKTLLEQNVISYLFWFISGYVVSQNTKLRDANFSKLKVRL